jgi:hypothetical protein
LAAAAPAGRESGTASPHDREQCAIDPTTAPCTSVRRCAMRGEDASTIGCASRQRDISAAAPRALLVAQLSTGRGGTLPRVPFASSAARREGRTDGRRGHTGRPVPVVPSPSLYGTAMSDHAGQHTTDGRYWRRGSSPNLTCTPVAAGSSSILLHSLYFLLRGGYRPVPVR